MRRTTYIYILKEILPIFFIGLLTFTVILLMDKILNLIELIVSGINLLHILALLFFVSPSFLVFTIPMAMLLGNLATTERLGKKVLPTLFRLAEESEGVFGKPMSIFHAKAMGDFTVVSWNKVLEYDKKVGNPEPYTLPDNEAQRWLKAIAPLYDKWVVEREAKSLPAKAVYQDALSLNQKYLKEYPKEKYP
jgi:hypothetical protein